MGKTKSSFSTDANPRGELWRKDESGFGFQMLAKMGWSKGRGLGRMENGISEPIKVRLKDGGKGLGYKNRNDHWMENLDQFDQLLADLNRNVSVETENAEGTESTKVIETLEEKSRKSNCRVHYRKFVRGKDTRQYSAEDMKAILGKRKNKQEIQPKFENEVDAEKKVMENQFETSKFNLHEYLNKKMMEKKAKLSHESLDEEKTNLVEEMTEVNDEDEKIKKKKKKRKHEKDCEDIEEGSTKLPKLYENEEESDEIVARKSKKCKKKKKESRDSD